MADKLDLKTAYDTYYQATQLKNNKRIWPLSIAPQSNDDLLSPVKIINISELSEQFKVFVFDGYGVLHVGAQVVPDMPTSVARLQRNGKLTYLLTNATSQTADTYPRKFERLGYKFSRAMITSSRDALVRWLNLKDDGRLWGIIADSSADWDDLGANNILMNDTATIPEAEGFIFLNTFNWNNKAQDELVKSLQNKTRPVLVANADVTAPVGNSYTTEPGYFALDIAWRTNVEPLFFGKPFAAIFNLAWHKIIDLQPDIKRNEVIMIGDTPFTDILGAKNMGWKSALMCDYGFMAKFGNYAQVIRHSKIAPDYIITAR